ncbi:L-threonylcarbamoyladenylate synthase [Clostridium botulinum]|uniref:L-threonylcarbamoyladenylate synthase n=1 Tax=Clostridium botulinum TaxID=1491 RepID=UPI00058624E1|nr:L-threonylcarbamoyladenylate synthase [Clostridium botulinum]AJD25713.1 tRNA threonylcarbamoyl adenosine modification protein, Sua5/YciO/YrdC/YwlC family [Clostridium botulinum CDC_297]APU59035.1 tRNA threonylcarbamoyl adenosine modification protein, Sua5/YciO/YrdC/YwlC family [Clostridium botulinum]MBY6877364.1 threonylcarbamoyl-AMP synthase [Clostridium botulinum]MBY6893036.1 threonylcarbamoyl-AMP synthase [Clostridium botulinum]MBY6896156.1 threonylcarbamoyl-AMP synthase [Clostridium bot
MKTKVMRLDENNIDEHVISKAGDILRQGGLVVFPTETVYGLGANALDKNAVKKIFKAKGRPQDNPLIVHISKMKDIEKLVQKIPSVAEKLMDKFWPGPLTIILKKKDIIPNETSAGLDSIGIRMPSNKIAMKLISMAGVPIAAPSANLSGKPSPTDVETCIEDLDGKVNIILGGDNSEVGVESTVIDCTINPPCILRPGGITLEMLKEVDSNIYIDPAIMKKPDKDLKPKAPGMKYRHYAPKAPLKIIKGDLNKTIEKINEMVQNYIDAQKKVGIIATDETIDNYKKGDVVSIGSRKDLNTIAHNLFYVLRSFDEKNVDLILSEAFEEKDMGVAIMNRLKKSAGYDIINLD